MNFSANNYDIELEGNTVRWSKLEQSVANFILNTTGRMSVASMSSGYHSLYSESRMSTTTECNMALHDILGGIIKL
jgi:hypothetical protein